MTYQEEKKAEAVKIKELNQKLIEVLKILKIGGIETSKEYLRIKSENIYFNSSASNKWIINVSGNYPRNVKNEYITVYEKTLNGRVNYDWQPDWTWKELRPQSINISSEKTAEQIAKDINRRFLPDYNKRLTLVNEKIQEEKNYQYQSEASLDYIIGRKPTEDEAQRKEVSFYHITGNLGKIEARGNNINIEISDLTKETAKENF